SNWLEHLLVGSITTWEHLTTRFRAQFFLLGRNAKLRNNILMFQQHHGESLFEAWTRFKDLLQKSLIMASTFGSKSKFFMTMSIPSQDEPLTNRPVVNKVTTSCEICSSPHNTQYCMEDPKQAFVEYASSRTDKAGEGLVSNIMASQDARLSKFKSDFKQQQNEMTNKIDTVLKVITNRIAGTLPSNTFKNPRLSTSPVLSACSFLTEDPQCSTHVHGSINAITICPKPPNEPQNDKSEEKEQGREGNPEDTNTMAHNEEQRDTPQLELKDTTAIDNLGTNRNDDGI
ncbi:MAK10-like protein, partial [Tanacetum coccineum]